MTDPVLNIAFIIAITSFFKKQMGLSGWKVLLAAFIVASFVGLTPVLIATFPVIAPWATVLLNLVILFLTAAGSVDFLVTLKTTTEPPTPKL